MMDEGKFIISLFLGTILATVTLGPIFRILDHLPEAASWLFMALLVVLIVGCLYVIGNYDLIFSAL